MGNRRDIDMDGGLFSGQRTADRRAATPNMSEAAAHKPVEVPNVPADNHRQSAPVHSKKVKKSHKRVIFPVVIVILLATIGLGVWYALSSNSAAAGIDSNKYQAVFFTNGQVYFGKLDSLNNNYLKLDGIFYLQTKTTDAGGSEDPQQSTAAASDVQLIKLGGEVHGPEDQMIISRDQVLFYENLKSDGKVSKLIDEYKNKN